ncbi:thiaminase II [uncultured Cohaesibacter sp.]|uniref:thiaminase II n=1 Tax=uncultured Cohaesibacter sp. TaxID=1002546 RepID=UPI0029C74FF3|nr:thiaminase II [uncultured Cohaesibacter sp.]
MTQQTIPNDYGRAFDLLRKHAKDPWHDYTHHSFVQSLGDGSLPREAFLHYLQQDYVFLVHFSRAWALAIVKSETFAEMQAATDMVNALVSHEMPMHVGICEAAGISKQALFATGERPENLAYTRFVLETGFSGDFLNLIVALAPCVMGYGEIGLRLQRDARSDKYADWISTYASEDYQEVCRSAGQLLDASLVQRIGSDFVASPRWERLCQTFRTATELEVGFWQMGLQP